MVDGRGRRRPDCDRDTDCDCDRNTDRNTDGHCDRNTDRDSYCDTDRDNLAVYLDTDANFDTHIGASF